MLVMQVLDAGGNWNNVLHVPAKAPIVTSKECLGMARWHALMTAFETKVGLG